LGHEIAAGVVGVVPGAADPKEQLDTLRANTATSVIRGGRLNAALARASAAKARLLELGQAPVSLLTFSFAVASLVLAGIAVSDPDAAASATLYAAIETGLTLVALAAAWLLRAHFVQTLRRRDLLLVAGAFTFGLVHLFACAVPAAFDMSSSSYRTAIVFCGEFLVAALFAAAALMSPERMMFSRHPGRRVILTASASLTMAVLLAFIVVGLSVTGAIVRLPGLVVMGGTAGFFACAAIGFARDARPRPDSNGWVLAAAAALLAAGLSSQLPTSFTVDPDSPSEALRVLGFVLILGAAIDWEFRARTLAASAAAIAERQRVARDLHDGLAQDLAFIAAHGERIASDIGEEHPVVVAARRALSVSRSAIAELSGPADASIEEVLQTIACELRKRFEISIALDVRLCRPVPSDVEEHISRIVREAVANAARHGNARQVAVSLRDDEGAIRLRVLDDGNGIDGANGGRPDEGFGLRSIRERVAGLGGQMTLDQAGRLGTVLEVQLPCALGCGC
jgi:signal transduction histidine kinase